MTQKILVSSGAITDAVLDYFMITEEEFRRTTNGISPAAAARTVASYLLREYGYYPHPVSYTKIAEITGVCNGSVAKKAHGRLVRPYSDHAKTLVRQARLIMAGIEDPEMLVSRFPANRGFE